MSDPQAIGEVLAAGVRRRFGDGARVEGLEPLLGGASRELWALEVVCGAGRRALVLRRDPPGVEDPPARRREWHALVAAHRHGVPVPEPLWLTDDATGLVMGRVAGETIPRRLLRDERYAGVRGALVGQLARAAASLHAIPVEELDGFAVPRGHSAVTGIESLEAELDRIGEPHPALELGLRWLRAHLPEPREPALVHGDLRLGNLMVDERGLVALLDWELCHLGDPAEDLGWLCVRSWRFGHDDRPVAGVGTRDELLAAYAAAAGRQVTRDELFFWEVFGNVRWGVICLVQADVHLSGAQPSLERAAIGRRTCEPEWDLLAMIG